MKVHLWPSFGGTDEGDGGVRQVWEAQRKSLPRRDVQFVDDPGDADLIATHITMPETYLRRFPDKPLVAHCHGLYWSEYGWQPWSYEANEQVLAAIRVADAVTAPSEWVARIIRRHTSRDVRVIPHGVSLRDWKPPSDNGGYVLWNKTRVDPVCDVAPLDALVRAMPEQSFVSTFGDEAPNLMLTGRLPFAKAKELVRHAGVYLCTSRETFGVGTLEAMASGVPIVGYAYGGQAEFLTHGKDGWLVEPGDIAGLVEGVRWALANRDEVGAAARETAGRFPWTAAAEMYHDLYRELIQRYDEHEGAPRTSVIITAYKLEEYLPDAIASVTAQTDPSWECIIVDDASPDRCGEIADAAAAADPRFTVIHNKTNQYLAEARNIGIKRARGRYILPLDADDQLAPETLHVLADALDSNRNLSVAYGGVYFTEPDGVTPTNYGLPGRTPGHSNWPVEFDPALQIQGSNLLPYSSMFRREAWRLVGGYRRRLRTAEDADFWTRLASYGFLAERVTTADTLVYRNRPGSMSRANEAQRFAYLRWYPWAVDPLSAPAGVAGPKRVSLLDPTVTVVIPVGPGHAQIVQDAVDSVAAQSYTRWDCLVVNDSGEQLFLPPWARVIESDARDPAASRNLGIAACRTSLYLPLDADDYLQPDALQWMLSAHVESDGEIIYPDFWEDPEKAGQFKPWALPDFSCDLLFRRGAMHSVTALTPVEAWRKVGGYKPHTAWEDWDFQIRCLASGYCSRRLAAPLFTYRKWTGTRRDYDRDEFERRKAQMMSEWGDYFEGVRTMPCGCGGQTIKPAMTMPVGPGGAPSEDAVLVEYTGAKQGTVGYRGKSGTIYSFAAGDPPKYVLTGDLVVFQSRQDFRVVRSRDLAGVGPVL